MSLANIRDPQLRYDSELTSLVNGPIHLWSTERYVNVLFRDNDDKCRCLPTGGQYPL